MVNYQMELGTLIFGIMPTFFPTMEVSYKRDGSQNKIDHGLPVTGWFSENTITDLTAKIDALRLIVAQGSPTTVVVKRLDTMATVYSIAVAKITNLTEQDSPGGRVNHIKFSFSLTEEVSSTYAGIVDYSKQDEYSKRFQDGALLPGFTRQVSATGMNGDVTAAKNFVMAQKPTGGPGVLVDETITEIHYDGTVTASWTYEVQPGQNATPEDPEEPAEENNQIRKWVETASRNPGHRAVTWYRTRSGPVPILGGIGPSSVTVSGNVEGWDISKLPTPDNILSRIKKQVPTSGRILTDSSWGSPEGIAADVDKPSKASSYRVTYSFTFQFSEWSENEVWGPQVKFFQKEIGGAAADAAGGSGAPPSSGGGAGSWTQLQMGIGGGNYSDKRLKIIEKSVGSSPSGIPIYQFTYKPDPSKKIYQGVLAQDIIEKYPDAVGRAETGFYAVDYDKIDVDFIEIGN